MASGPQEFPCRIEVDDISSEDIIVVLLGPSGTGKSTFINTAIESEGYLAVGRNLEPCTKEIQVVRCTYRGDSRGRNVVLVDIPALNDDLENKSIPNTEATMTQWLEKIYARHNKVAGILYLHDISKNRITDSPRRYSKIYEMLCGSAYPKKFLFLLTMWSRISSHTGSRHEAELRTNTFKSMIDLGSRVMRFDRTCGSAWSAIDLLVKERRDFMPTHSDLTPSIKELSDEDIIIAVMGATGSGRSSFINMFTGEYNRIGHNLESFTGEVSTIKFQCIGRTELDVVFVDTPGFNDTNKTDLGTVNIIANWLKATYERKVKLAGILYFHRISDNRMAGTPLKNLRTFEKLCGKDALANVVLVTTMWDELDDEETGRQRETELKEKYWKPLIDQGSKTVRYKNTPDSACEIVNDLLQNAKRRYPLRLQEEMVDMKCRFHETEAGKQLSPPFEEILRKQKETLQRIQIAMKGHAGESVVSMLKKEYDALRKELQSILGEMGIL